MNVGEYKVVGRRTYRGHAPGTVFQARINKAAEVRAVGRGDIRLLRVVTPTLQPSSLTLPDGWENTNREE